MYIHNLLIIPQHVDAGDLLDDARPPRELRAHKVVIDNNNNNNNNCSNNDCSNNDYSDIPIM